jgi:carbamoyl-phosphate synthase small subunit
MSAVDQDSTRRDPSRRPEALLVLADGTIFEGEAIGAVAPDGVATGEVVFNTVLSGYQEVITDPSYAGQIIAFTYPHIGNYGVNPADAESARPFCRGIIVRDLSRRRSNWRSSGDLEDFLVRHRLSGITGIDTRRLTRHLRQAGSMPGAFGTADEVTLKAAAVAAPPTDGVDLVAEVTTPEPYTVSTDGPFRVVAYDFGIKRAILNQLAGIAAVEVVPASTPAADVLARRPDGVFLSNGPGDPSAVPYASAAIGQLLGRVPVFGICLGHQLLATAVSGGSAQATFKLPFGHHGGNHPVRRLATGAVEITSQNHNYAVDADLMTGATLTHVNLNDGVCEGLSLDDYAAFSVQYHPEAGPGPHDARYLFSEFAALMERAR